MVLPEVGEVVVEAQVEVGLSSSVSRILTTIILCPLRIASKVHPVITE
jgi:hypothetical protein